MQRWFLSYHSPDQPLAERLKAALERKDASGHVFFAPSNLRAGGFWSKALAEEIAQAQAFILLVGESGVGDWQVLEYDEALDKRVRSPDFPVILVLLEGQTAPGLPFLRRLHWIVTPDPSSEESVARLLDATSGAETRPGELWRYTSPYRGLVAMEARDSDYFFGRERDTVEVLNVLASAPDRMPVLLGNSGVGKSSLAQAGVLAALMRQAWPETTNAGAWPHAFQDSRRWCFLTLRPGTEPVRALVEAFLTTWQLDSTSIEWPRRRAEWTDDLVAGKLTLRDLLDQTERRYAGLQLSKPTAFFLYLDQGEELYVRSEPLQRERFSELLASDIADPRLHALMSLRADFYGELQRDKPLYKLHHFISVAPLDERELHEIVSRPAALLSARFDTDGLPVALARRAAEDTAKDAGALPLLSYLLDDMWTQMVARGDGVLRLPSQALELGDVLVQRANAFIGTHPGSEEMLRRIFTLKLATVREDGEPTRRRATRSEFSQDEWRLVSELADHPNRLVITGTSDTGDTYAEIAHEAVFKRWEKLRDWVAAEREFLAWRTGLEAARRIWQATPKGSKKDAVLRGAALIQAQSRLGRRSGDIPEVDREFVVSSHKAARGRKLRKGAVIGMLILPTLFLSGGLFVMFAGSQPRFWDVSTSALTAQVEQALKPGDRFTECANCPEMVVVPAGSFMMGSPENETGRYDNEGPQRLVTIATPFAVAKFEITTAEWSACAAHSGCDDALVDPGVAFTILLRYYLNVTVSPKPQSGVPWDKAKQYGAWIAQLTGKPYRLLTEAEWEYAARAGKQTRYSWGDEIGTGNASCKGCGQDKRDTYLVGRFAPNAFGLYDMHGGVWEWVEDCYHDNYDGAPIDGSAWTAGSRCAFHVVRGGSRGDVPEHLRSASRNASPSSGFEHNTWGVRVARTLNR